MQHFGIYIVLKLFPPPQRTLRQKNTEVLSSNIENVACALV